MNTLFLSRNNVNNVYQQLQQGILKHSQFDLNSDPTYRKIVKNMLHMVHKHHNVDTSTLQSLNTLAFQKITPYMLQIVSQGGILGKQKTQTTNNETNNEKNQNITSIDESVFLEIKDENTKMLEENVHIAQQKTEEEIFKNAYASNTNDILHTIEEDTQNLIEPANTGALDSSYVMPGVEVSASGHNYETINVDFDDPSISNLTPKALNVVNTKKTKEEFTTQEETEMKDLKKRTQLIEKLIESLTENHEEFSNMEDVDINTLDNQTKDKIIKVVVLDTGTSYNPLCDKGSKSIEEKRYWTDVTFTLKQPLMILEPGADVYLESLTINNPAVSNNISNMYFSFDFDFLNEEIYSNNKIFENKFVIPNENTSGAGDNKIMKYHLKSNYLGVCQGKSIKQINVKIKNEDGHSIQLGRNIVTEPDSQFKDLTFTITNNTAQGTTTAFDISPKMVVTLEGGISRTPDTYYLDAFTSDGTKVGRITEYSDEDLSGNPGDPTTIRFEGGTLVDLTAGQVLSFSQSSVNVKVLSSIVPKGHTGAFNLTGDPTGLVTNERIYNKNGVELGIVTAISDTGSPDFHPTITIGGGISTQLSKNDELFFAPARSRYVFFGEKAIGSADEVEKAKADDGQYKGVALQLNQEYASQTDLERDGMVSGVMLYNRNGTTIGIIDIVEVRKSDPSPVKADAGALFFVGGIRTALSSGGEPIFREPPSSVFNNNDRSNRIIMELIFRQK